MVSFRTQCVGPVLLSSAYSHCNNNNNSYGPEPDQPTGSDCNEEYASAEPFASPAASECKEEDCEDDYDECNESERTHATQVRQMEKEMKLRHVLRQLEAYEIKLAEAKAERDSEMALARKVEQEREQAEMDLQAAKLTQDDIEVKIDLAKGRLKYGHLASQLAKEKALDSSARLEEMRRQEADLTKAIETKQALLTKIDQTTQARQEDEVNIGADVKTGDEANVEGNAEDSTNKLQRDEAIQKVETKTPLVRGFPS